MSRWLIRLSVGLFGLTLLLVLVPAAPSQFDEPPPQKAYLDIQVPANAKLVIEGQVTKSTGLRRHFESPPIVPGKRYVYTVKCTFTDPDGNEITRTEIVEVTPGKTVLFDWTKPKPEDKTKTKPEIPPLTKPDDKTKPEVPPLTKPDDKTKPEMPPLTKPGDKTKPEVPPLTKPDDKTKPEVPPLTKPDDKTKPEVPPLTKPDDKTKPEMPKIGDTPKFDDLKIPGLEDKTPSREPDVIFLPTKPEVVDKMLELAEVKKTDIVYDLGCGDGRIPVAAAKKYGCKAWGFDIDPERVKDSLENVKKNKVEDLVTIEEKDIFTLDLSKANVVTLYLLPSLNVKLLPQLAKLKDGSRIVSHDFDIKGYKPDKVVKVEVSGHPHTVFLWTTPLQKEKE